jgi:ParB family chromosome partitioning protein
VDKRITRWPLDRLKPHPRQAALFRDLDDEAFKGLVEDLRINGQQQPIEALPDGTIVCGHQRLRAAKELGWEEVEVCVREDLAEEGDVAVELRIISDNLHRRQLDKLDLARSYRRLRELEQDLPPDERKASCSGDLRDILARKLGSQSGRNHDRYLRVLQTPPEVQEAFSQGKLSLVEAGKVAGLSLDAQHSIAAAIRAGQKPKDAVKTCVKEQESVHSRGRRHINLARSILRSLDELEADLAPLDLDNEANRLLRKARERLSGLLAVQPVPEPTLLEALLARRDREYA